MAIDALGGISRTSLPARPGLRAGAGFQLPGQPAAAAPPAEVAFSGMLALQEVDDAEHRDRAARRRGQELLTELAALQRALLSPAGAASEAVLHRLAALAQAVPLAANPALAQAVAAILLRSRVELARYHHDNSENTSPLHR